MQAALVDLAQAGDHAAATTLLTQLCPGLWRIVGRGHRHRSTCDAVQPDDVAAVAYETIMRHPLDRRPASIAANVILDTRQRLWRAAAAAARRSCSPPLRAPAAWCPRPTRQPPRGSPIDEPDVRVEELDILDRVAIAIERSTGDPRSQRLSAEIAYRAWILDEATPSIAEAVGLRPDAVRARLSRLRAVVRTAGAGPDRSTSRLNGSR